MPEITPTAAPGEAPRRYPDRILPKNAEAAVKLKAARSPTFTTSARAGSPTRTTRSTAPSPPLTAGPRTFRPRTPSPACSRSILRERASVVAPSPYPRRKESEFSSISQPQSFPTSVLPNFAKAHNQAGMGTMNISLPEFTEVVRRRAGHDGRIRNQQRICARVDPHRPGSATPP